MRQACSTDHMERARPLAQTVYAKLLDKILNGTWTPGSLYDRRSVAKELGVSIAPVGEAMLRLEHDGFLVSFPRKGTMLRPCDPQRLYESLILREAVECEAVMLAFKRLEAAAPGLRSLAGKADNAQDAERRKSDAAFHMELVALSGVKKLLETLEHINMQMLFDELRLLDAAGKAGGSHLKLLAGLLKAPNPEAAAGLMRKHLRSSRETLINRFER